MILPLTYIEPTRENLIAILPRMPWPDAANMLETAQKLIARRLDLIACDNRGFMIVGRDGPRYIVQGLAGRHILGPSLLSTLAHAALSIGCNEILCCTKIDRLARFLMRHGYKVRENLPDGMTVYGKVLCNELKIIQHNQHTDHHDDSDQQFNSDTSIVGCVGGPAQCDYIKPWDDRSGSAFLHIGFNQQLQHGGRRFECYDDGG